MTKQVIVVNKGLGMTKGKMSAQVAHASEAFLLKRYELGYGEKKNNSDGAGRLCGYTLQIPVDLETYNWITSSSYTKVVCEVNSEAELQKVVDKAIKNGFIENKDFFKIIDNGYTEFNNEKTWTCIGFKPMESEKIDKVTKRLRLFKDTDTLKSGGFLVGDYVTLKNENTKYVYRISGIGLRDYYVNITAKLDDGTFDEREVHISDIKLSNYKFKNTLYIDDLKFSDDEDDPFKHLLNQ